MAMTECIYLIEANVFGETARPDGVQQAKRSKTVNIALVRNTGPEHAVSSSAGRRGASRKHCTHCVFRHVERDLDVTLRGQVVDFRWPDLRDDINEVRRVCEVAVVKDHVGSCI